MSKDKSSKGAAVCHKGNVVVMHQPDGGKLLCGGWTRGAVTSGLAVIDLTGREPIDMENPISAVNDSASVVFKEAIALASAERGLPWLSFEIRDFGTPNVDAKTWRALADAISELMDQGHSILIACQGGHGRTGLAASIICYMLNPDIGDPVEYLRSVYCESAVETRKQHLYVHQMCGLPEPKELYYKGDYVASTTAWKPAALWNPNDVWDNKTMSWKAPSETTVVANQVELERLKPEEINQLRTELNELGTDYSEVVYSAWTELEVCLLVQGDLIYYTVIGYFPEQPHSSVKLLNEKTYESRMTTIDFLATTKEIDKIYDAYELSA